MAFSDKETFCIELLHKKIPYYSKEYTVFLFIVTL